MNAIIACQYRHGLDPLLKTNKSELSFVDTILRMRTRKDIEPKFGKVVYSLTLYEKVRRATILPDSEEDPILLVTLDNTINDNKQVMNQESLVLDGILPVVSSYLTSFSDEEDLAFTHDGRRTYSNSSRSLTSTSRSNNLGT